MYSNLRSFIYLCGFPSGAEVKNLSANVGDARDTGLISQLGRFHRVGNGNIFQYSYLENPKEKGTWWATAHRVTKSWDIPEEAS